MKNIVFKASILCLTLVFFASCSTKRKGCGLTSDAKKIEAATTMENQTIVAAE